MNPRPPTQTKQKKQRKVSKLSNFSPPLFYYFTRQFKDSIEVTSHGLFISQIRIYLFIFFMSTDINECSSNTDDCSILATCMNTDGSYLCECIDGYTGNGFVCAGNRNNMA